MQARIAAAAVGGGAHMCTTAMWDRQVSMQTLIAAAAVVGSPHGTPAMWGR